jgi:N-acetylglucosaminyl-diphospho-decaprenol L-rhamnosyltransferase
MDISIIVVSYNTRELLAACLRSVANASLAGVEYEVLVVDNSSVDGSADMVVTDFPHVRLLRNCENRGFAAANNQALAVARGRYVLLLNSDALLSPEALPEMIAYMDAQPKVGVLGGQLFNPDGTFQSSYFDFPDWRSELLLLTGIARWLLGTAYPSYAEAHSQETRRVDWVSGALFMVRRQAMNQVGAFDEDYFMYAEEMDWCFRMRKAGWDVAYLPQAQAVHISAGSAHRQPERRRTYVYGSKSLFVRKHWGSWQAKVFIALVRVSSFAKLSWWWIQGRITGGSRRASARSQVASYRFLLANLGGVLDAA